MADLPRVSLLLIAYTQERFAWAAARSALAQDYPNLQVILSDDCSPDATFAELQRAAREYGRDAIVRQPERNQGLIGHIWDAASLADGDLLVLAAGDDISYPGRVSALVDRWLETGADALTSNWDVIDADGVLVRRGRPEGHTDLRLNAFFPGWRAVQLIGATAAYSLAFFNAVQRPSAGVFAEDLYLSLMLGAFRRSAAYVERPLIQYRAHGSAMTHVSEGPRGVEEFERSLSAESRKIALLLEAFECDAQALGKDLGVDAAVDWEAVHADRDFNLFRARWMEASLGERLRALAGFRAAEHRRWLLPRMFGLRALLAIKRAARRG